MQLKDYIASNLNDEQTAAALHTNTSADYRWCWKLKNKSTYLQDRISNLVKKYQSRENLSCNLHQQSSKRDERETNQALRRNF